MVQSNFLTVRQLPQLSYLLEAELISGELVGEAGGAGGELLRYVPHPVGELGTRVEKQEMA